MSQWSHLYNDRRWRRLREQQRTKQPLCEKCLEEGRVTAMAVCDHVEPHKGDLVKFWAGPFQSLCKYHHDVKTIMEDGGMNSAGQAFPQWLPKPACPVVLVTGPPGAGKTTHARAQATIADDVIDLDDCFEQVCGVHGHTADKKHLGQALRLRNKLIANLASKRTGKAYLIVSAPSVKECQWWQDKLGASLVRLDPGRDTCLQRVGPARASIVHDWYRKAERNEWVGPKQATSFDESGVPTNAGHPWAAEGRGGR